MQAKTTSCLAGSSLCLIMNLMNIKRERADGGFILSGLCGFLQNVCDHNRTMTGGFCPLI